MKDISLTELGDANRALRRQIEESITAIVPEPPGK